MSSSIRNKRFQPNGVVRYYILSVIGIAIMLLFKYIPPIGVVTKMGMEVLGIYLGLLLLWSTVDVIWPSFLGLILLGFSGYSTVPQLITTGFGNVTNIYIMLIFMFAYFVTKSGVSNILVNSIISLKFARSRPWVISFLFLFAAYFVGALVSMTPACVIVWTIFTKFAAEIGYKKSDAYTSYMIVGIALSGLMGFVVFPFRLPSTLIIGMAEQAGYTVPFLSYVIIAFCIGFGAVILYLLLGRFVFRPNVENLKKEYSFGELNGMTRYQKQIMFLVVLLIALLIVQSTMGTTFIGSILTQLGTTGIVLVILMIMAFLKRSDGSPFADLVDAARNGVSWSVYFMLTICLQIATALSDSELGIGALISSFLEPILGTGNGGKIAFILLMTFLTILFTNFMGNNPVAIIFYSIAITYCGKSNVPTALMVSVIGICANASIVFPSANPIAAIMHGMKDWVNAKDIYKYSVPLSIAVWVSASVFCLLLGGKLF